MNPNSQKQRLEQIRLDEQTSLEDKSADASEYTKIFSVYLAGSIAAIATGALIDNETLGSTLMLGGILSAPAAAAGIYLNMMRYLGLEKQLDQL